ncbi:hypothetical protein AY600_17460 [Phormidium willei BDU 130791]|nr:hypothetical protein AY600_17460 [Phormidium willei BDU 130791]
MSLVAKEDVAMNPLNVGLYGTVVFDWDSVTHAIAVPARYAIGQLLGRRLHGLGMLALGNIKLILRSLDVRLKW